jgi:uncharacterized protein YbcI
VASSDTERTRWSSLYLTGSRFLSREGSSLDDLIVVVMRGSGFTSLEKTIMDSGDPDRVIAMRHDFQRMMTKRFTETIEGLTGRRVVAFLSQAHVEPDITMEIFFVDGPLQGFGALELIEPE